MKSKILAAVVVSSVILALVGCSAPASSGTDSSGKTTINWSVWAGSEAETAAWQHLADLVHTKEPSITVKLQTASWNDYWTKLPTQLAGADAPCIAGMQMARLQQFTQYLLPLDDKLAGAGITPSDFDGSIMKALQTGGKQKAIPYDLGPWILFYNKDQFAAAGLTEPANGWKIAEFEADAKALTTGGKYGFAVNNTIDQPNVWGPTIAGVQAVTKDGALDLTSPGVKKTLDWYAGLVSTEKVAAPLAADATDGAQFLAGNAAMYVTGPWDMINVKAQAKFGVGVVTIPAGSKGVATAVGGSGFGITTKCSTPGVAAKALAILTGSDALSYLGSEGRAFPARIAEQSTWYSSAVDGAKSTMETALKSGVAYRSTPTWTQVGLSWSQGVVSVVNGETNSKAFLSSVQESNSQ
ncbi:ABC transporter substrate-binding protein [Lacisediminihabitans sp. FW035]